MQKVKLEDGTEIDTYTEEELQAQKDEAIEQFKAENPDKSAELAELQEKLRVADEELAKKGDGDRNFANLRKAKEEAEKKLTDFDSKLEEKVNQAKREVIEGVNQDYLQDNLK